MNSYQQPGTAATTYDLPSSWSIILRVYVSLGSTSATPRIYPISQQPGPIICFGHSPYRPRVPVAAECVIFLFYTFFLESGGD